MKTSEIYVLSRRGSKESPMLFYIVFQPILEEVYATCEDLKVRLLSAAGCEWSLGHLGYGDDLCLINSSIGHAENLYKDAN